MHTKESELKPCPFCGSPGSLFASSDHSGAWEGGCSGEGCVANDLVWDTSKELAVATWNRRASPAEDVRREALEEAAKVAERGCLTHPDGGSPTEPERELCEAIARDIRALTAKETER
jgi:hypothetical protein